MDMWLREVSKFGGENLPVVVVGTKADQVHRRSVTLSQAEEWVKSRGFVKYIEVSAEKPQEMDPITEIAKKYAN